MTDTANGKRKRIPAKRMSDFQYDSSFFDDSLDQTVPASPTPLTTPIIDSKPLGVLTQATDDSLEDKLDTSIPSGLFETVVPTGPSQQPEKPVSSPPPEASKSASTQGKHSTESKKSQRRVRWDRSFANNGTSFFSPTPSQRDDLPKSTSNMAKFAYGAEMRLRRQQEALTQLLVPGKVNDMTSRANMEFKPLNTGPSREALAHAQGLNTKRTFLLSPTAGGQSTCSVIQGPLNAFLMFRMSGQLNTKTGRDMLARTIFFPPQIGSNSYTQETVLAYDDQRADAYVLNGIARHHPDVFRLIGLDGHDELPTLPLRHFRAIWIAESSLREGSVLVQPPTPLAPTHSFICNDDYELLAKYCITVRESSDVTCGETLTRLSELYTSGPATAADQFHSLLDAPTEEQLTQNATYFGKQASKPTYFKVGVENVVLAFTDAPGGPFPEIGVLAGLQVVHDRDAVLNIKAEDLVVSWTTTATKKQKESFSKALKAAFKAGLSLAVKTDRLTGFSVPLVMDLETVSLLTDVATSAGHIRHQLPNTVPGVTLDAARFLANPYAHDKAEIKKPKPTIERKRR